MRPAALAWLAAAAAVVIAAFVGGRALHGARAENLAFDLNATSYQSIVMPAGITRSGFTGFSEIGGIEGRVVLSGRVTTVAPESLTLATAQGSVNVRLSGDHSLRRINVATTSVVTNGSTIVIVHKTDSDEAQAILLISGP